MEEACSWNPFDIEVHTELYTIWCTLVAGRVQRCGLKKKNLKECFHEPSNIFEALGIGTKLFEKELNFNQPFLLLNVKNDEGIIKAKVFLLNNINNQTLLPVTIRLVPESRHFKFLTNSEFVQGLVNNTGKHPFPDNSIYPSSLNIEQNNDEHTMHAVRKIDEIIIHKENQYIYLKNNNQINITIPSLTSGIFLIEGIQRKSGKKEYKIIGVVGSSNRCSFVDKGPLADFYCGFSQPVLPHITGPSCYLAQPPYYVRRGIALPKYDLKLHRLTRTSTIGNKKNASQLTREKQNSRTHSLSNLHMTVAKLQYLSPHFDSLLERLLEDTPVWLPQVLRFYLPDFGSLPQHKKTILHGPWRGCVCRTGYSPQHNKSSAKYQSIDFRDPLYRSPMWRTMFRTQLEKNETQLKRGVRPIAADTTVVLGGQPLFPGAPVDFEGLVRFNQNKCRSYRETRFIDPPSRRSQLYQLCDIDDQAIQLILMKQALLLNECDLTFGWYSNETIRRVRELMVLRSKRLRGII